MPYLPTLNAFLHSASLLLAAYPTARITTKYSLPRGGGSKEAAAAPAATNNTDTETNAPREKKEPSATLTVKVFHAATGICLKYTTDKAQEVGRLITSLGRLARGEVIEVPAVAAGGAVGAVGEDAADKMDVDAGPAVAVKQQDAVAAGKPVGQQQQQQQGQAQGQSGGGGGKKKKKGKR